MKVRFNIIHHLQFSFNVKCGCFQRGVSQYLCCTFYFMLGAVKASYIIAWEIAKVSKPFSEGAFVKDKYASVGIQSFYQSLPPEYPIITAFAGKILCMFGTTYLCEQAFSVMNINKSKLRSRLTHGHLNDVMKIATAQSLSPNVDKLVKSKRLLASTCKM